MPKAYVVGQLNLTNPEAFKEDYGSKVLATVEKFHGRYIVRGGEITNLEEVFPWGRAVIIEFPDKEAALAWYHSPEYQEIIPGRLQSSTTLLTILEGV